MQKIIRANGAIVVASNMCRFGMRIDDGNGQALVRKDTKWMTNLLEVARELNVQCQGGHRHACLLDRRAHQAQVYPPELCKAINRGFSRQKRCDEQGICSVGLVDKDAWQ